MSGGQIYLQLINEGNCQGGTHYWRRCLQVNCPSQHISVALTLCAVVLSASSFSLALFSAFCLGFELVVKPAQFTGSSKETLLRWNTYRRSYIDASLIATKLSVALCCLAPAPALFSWKLAHYLFTKAYTADSYVIDFGGEGTMMLGRGFFYVLGAWFMNLVGLEG